MKLRIRLILFSASSNFQVTTKLVFPESSRTGQEGDWNCGERTCDSDCCVHSESTHFSEGAAVLLYGELCLEGCWTQCGWKAPGHVFARIPFLHSPPWRAGGLGHALWWWFSHSFASSSLWPHGLWCWAPLSLGFPRRNYWSGLHKNIPGKSMA